MKSAGKHHCYWREAFKWWKAVENTSVIEEKRSDDEKAVKHNSYWKEAFKWWKVRENTTVIEGNLSNDEKREKKPLLVLKRSVRVMKSAAKVKRTVPGKAHEERQYKFEKFGLVPHRLKLCEFVLTDKLHTAQRFKPWGTKTSIKVATYHPAAWVCLFSADF